MRKSIVLTLVSAFSVLAPTFSAAQASDVRPSKCYSHEVPHGATVSEFGDVGYWNDPARFQLGYTIPLLRNGLPMGIARSCAPPTGRSRETLPQQMDRIFVEGQSHAVAIESVRSQVHSSIVQNRPLAAPPMPVLTAPPVSAALPREFRACARDALRNLKRRLTINALGSVPGASISSEASLALGVIAETLRTEAGRNGFPCGRGIAALEHARVQDDVEAVKSLMALAARPSIQERSRLAVALALASDEGRSEELRQAWRLVWNRMSLIAIINSTALPTAIAIAIEAAASSSVTAGSASLAASPPGGGTAPILFIEASRQFGNLPALVAEGEQIASEIYEHN